MKTFFWIFTVVGLLPVSAFAILHVASRIALRREIGAEPGDIEKGTFISAISTVQLGDSMPPMVVNTRAWPAFLILLGTVGCLIGLFFLIPRQPLRISGGGYAQVESLIQQVLNSTNEHPSFIVSARNGNEAMLVMRGTSGLDLSWSADSTRIDSIAAIRSYFAARDVQPSSDYTTHDDHFDINTTHLAFPLGGDSAQIASICVHVFRDILGVTNDEPIEFTVEP